MKNYSSDLIYDDTNIEGKTPFISWMNHN